MKILTVCGLGMGSSLILKMNVESVLRKFGIQASVEHMDVSSAASANADLVITNAELVDNLQHLTCPVVIVNNYIDNQEIARALQQAGILPQGE
ncbi:PTS sugar transporter subunit IIB [Yersinia intermedia]|uniref:PTS sugar transporter subunit IIB n=1 Tax=Yersinia intermedia TaxID=631 RepID=UPI000B7490E4|nr:PTS sugar transporter subunit IIB [Yersinia intermedia]MCW8112799.1 PTS sugar transporter subunit IIB [Yersinia intermedia]MDA5481871.1 PTS sugar transporter subunit IIB [Yersinia intermedia]MDA5516519.1 PTS sugar transporter subunit IIB [Yersinia intermedia]OWF92320.1 PTS ascorbate transporter subunit IIB [Yersinia intermedia]